MIEQGDRGPDDGPIDIRHNDDDTYTITVTHKGETQSITASRFNTARVFGVLAILMNAGVPASVLKRIKI